jgi:hypothetical protein
VSWMVFGMKLRVEFKLDSSFRFAAFRMTSPACYSEVVSWPKADSRCGERQSSEDNLVGSFKIRLWRERNDRRISTSPILKIPHLIKYESMPLTH